MQKMNMVTPKKLFTMLVMLLISSALFAGGSVVRTAGTTLQMVASLEEAPKLSLKESAVADKKLTVTYTLSSVSDAVSKVLTAIKNSHKPGATVGYELHVFDVDKTEKTLKVTMDAGIATPEELMAYLQKQIENGLKSEE
jgi:hypothetical protein